MADNAPLRVGLVGGNPERGWARDAHAPALRALPRFTIAGVSARTLETAQAAARAFGAARGYETLDMVRSPDIDVVAVTVKVPEHLPIVLAALEAGKHVFCEWPLGRDAAEAEAMTEAAGRSGGCAIIGLQGLAAPAVRRAAQIVRSGALGRLLTARVVSPTAGWGPAAPGFYAYLSDRSSGATLSTIAGGHTLAVAEAVLGGLVELQAQSAILHPKVQILGTDQTVERTCPDHLAILGTHDSGCVSTIEIAGSRPPGTPFLLEVIGTDGELRVTGARAAGGFQAGDLQLETTLEAQAAPAAAVPQLRGPPANVSELYAMLAAAVDGGAGEAPGFPAALRLTRLLDTVDRAAETGNRQRPGGG
jgi:predicted dehydrogenase